MCYAKPGPRCTAHTRQALDRALASGDDSVITSAYAEYYRSPGGNAELRQRAESERDEAKRAEIVALADRYAKDRRRAKHRLREAQAYAVGRGHRDDSLRALRALDAPVVAIDLETAGPPLSRGGFDPAQGAIIEVAVVSYDRQGREIDRWSTLVQPLPDVAAAHGTGEKHVHGISMEDVSDAPSWESVAPEVRRRLAGAVVVAHNHTWDSKWLQHHAYTGEESLNELPVASVDTVLLSRGEHIQADSHRLSEVAGRLGIKPDAEHRAGADAAVAGAAYFRFSDMALARAN